MDLKKFYMAMEVLEREAFAERCGTTRRHLENICYGKTCGEDLAINIDRESRGIVKCETLRPDVDFPYLRGTSTGTAQSSPAPVSNEAS